jgi:histidyl-tRNA synthetase
MKKISGYPEWLPQEKIVEEKYISVITDVFRKRGFCPLETRSVEPTSVLLKNGEDTDKEIYLINRISGENAESKRKLGLHFDLTVPFARYVEQNLNELDFPFKRSQLQKAWRGERPQEGRFREFYQFDVDVVDINSLSLYYDVEVSMALYEAIENIGLNSRIEFRVNNRKVLEGFYRSLGITNIEQVFRTMDKIDKIGHEGITKIMTEELGISGDITKQCIELAGNRGNSSDVLDMLQNLEVSDELFSEGVEELSFLFKNIKKDAKKDFLIDLSIARGLDYYTGFVIEGKMKDYPEYPTVCSGGRYDNLISGGNRSNFPGVGISIGLTRILAKLFKEKIIDVERKTPSQVLIVWAKGDSYAYLESVAIKLRDKGVNAEVYLNPEKKVSSQIQYADKKKIPYVGFVKEGNSNEIELKKLTDGVQSLVSLNEASRILNN